MHDLNTLMKTDPKEGVRRLCEAYGGLVYFAVRRVLRDFSDDDAEECVSDVFLYLYRHRKRLDFEGAAFKSYLIKTATHIAQDHVRRSKRMPVPTDELWDATKSERSAEELAIANMEGEALLQAIRSLGEPDATILYTRLSTTDHTLSIELPIRAEDLANIRSVKLIPKLVYVTELIPYIGADGCTEGELTRLIVDAGPIENSPHDFRIVRKETTLFENCAIDILSRD